MSIKADSRVSDRYNDKKSTIWLQYPDQFLCGFNVSIGIEWVPIAPKTDVLYNMQAGKRRDRIVLKGKIQEVCCANRQVIKNDIRWAIIIMFYWQKGGCYRDKK